MSESQAKRKWIADVLGAGLAHGAGDAAAALATSAARAAETPEAAGGVAFRKLLLRWRDAQQTAEANLASIVQQVLAHPDVSADPRVDAITQATRQLPGFLPKFGEELADAIDAGINASDPRERSRLASDAIRVAQSYRDRLAGASELQVLETFAADELGAKLPLFSALDDALSDIADSLAVA